jgi:hypothetical protein
MKAGTNEQRLEGAEPYARVGVDELPPGGQNEGKVADLRKVELDEQGALR